MVLKTLSTHIISLRRRVQNSTAPPGTTQDWEEELALCVSSRNKLESEGE